MKRPRRRQPWQALNIYLLWIYYILLCVIFPLFSLFFFCFFFLLSFFLTRWHFFIYFERCFTSWFCYLCCKITTSFYVHEFKNILLRTHRANLLLWVLTEVRVDCFYVTSRELYIRSEREKMFKKFYIQHSCVSVCGSRPALSHSVFSYLALLNKLGWFAW